ncbi:hypothetical protein IVN40_05300 [Chryseobacterium indologenes]|uniref:Uncharacterized protein n=3 Tax=Chryseobacterium TaxID=59732 RepID=A0A1M5KVH2_9FLAO|nr:MULTISPECIES: hypothetical protein [Chryseobacterium]KMQ64456.1 hypothetical protein ACM46_09280 [Chryseobacterium angstadtii]MBF6643598.1 hypothetical protein [Chryseobacterium indologenes]SHG56153.1 hypothetical protein SAMN05421866_0832 [Chryseobacterium oranimense]
MKRIYYLSMLLTLFVGFQSCKKDHVSSLENSNQQVLSLKAAFEKQHSDSGLPADRKNFSKNFNTQILWDSVTFKTADTAIVRVKLLSDVKIFTNDSIPVDLSNNLILKATKNQKREWDFVKVIYLPEYGKDIPNGFTGRIISEGYFDNNFTVTKYYGGKAYFSTFNADNSWLKDRSAPKLKAGGLPGDPRCQPEEEEDQRTVEGYVEGQLNTVWTFPKTKLPHAACSDDPIPTGTGGGGAPGAPSDNFPKPNVDELKNQLKNKPFALIPNIDCAIIKKWLAMAKFAIDQSTKDKIRKFDVAYFGSPVSHALDINDAFSPLVNMDYFPINIDKMPTINGKTATPEQFQEHIRKNINNFVDTYYSKFSPYDKWGVADQNLWNSSNPKNAVITIDILGPDNGSVIVSKYNSGGWTFTTIFEPQYKGHPVSGNRDFGFVKNANGSYTFYTRGVDRLSYIDGSNFQAVANFFGVPNAGPFGKADALWNSYQKMVSDFVNKNGGKAAPGKQEIHRPDWNTVKDVIDGKKPLSTLSSDCKD